MRHLSLTTLVILLTLTSVGQTPLKRNTVYFELGGNALFTSINYERKLFKNVNLTAHVGTGIYGVTPTYMTIPFGVNYLFKIKGGLSFIDIGLGATYSKADVKLYTIVDRKDPNFKQTDFWNYIPSLGYRKATKRNIMYRFCLTPVFNHNDMMPFLGFSIGKGFN